jgi:hypothetical protein
MKHLIPTLLLPLIAFGLQSCDPDKQTPCEDSYTTVNLTDFQKTRCPYTGNDTLIFVSDQKDTAYCYGRGKSVYYETKQEASSPDCRNYSKNETIEYLYDCNNNKLTNKLKITMGLVNGKSSSIGIMLNDRIFYEGLNAINDKTYLYEVIINNKSYKTTLFPFTNNDSLCYNHHNGIVRLSLTSQGNWNIIE